MSCLSPFPICIDRRAVELAPGSYGSGFLDPGVFSFSTLRSCDVRYIGPRLDRMTCKTKNAAIIKNGIASKAVGYDVVIVIVSGEQFLRALFAKAFAALESRRLDLGGKFLSHSRASVRFVASWLCHS